MIAYFWLRTLACSFAPACSNEDIFAPGNRSLGEINSHLALRNPQLVVSILQ
jgi:hypothetical protein